MGVVGFELDYHMHYDKQTSRGRWEEPVTPNARWETCPEKSFLAPAASPPQPKVGGLCYACGRYGHHQRDCTYPRTQMDDKPCFSCGKSGHRSKCPAPSKGVNGGNQGGGVALGGTIAPRTLPMLPGPEKPRSELSGKWLVVIHTAGLEFC